MLNPILNPEAFQHMQALHNRFANAAPFRHIVIDEFFRPEFARQLLNEFPPFEKGNSMGDNGRRGNKSTWERITALGPAFTQLDANIKGADFLGFVQKLTGIDALLYDPYYFGGGTHENRHGQNLQAHVDFNYHPSERWHRRLNLIVYLNPEWDATWGGNLQLYGNPYRDTKPAISVIPKMNRAVLFETTESSWHGFDRIALPAEHAGLSRRSVALYFYSRQRPAEEIAGKHSTHYVNRQLPDHFAEGHQLNADDVALLRELIANRDNQLRNLYDENAKLLQAQERGLRGQFLYLLRRFYMRYRR